MLVAMLWGQALFGEEGVRGGHEGDVVVPAIPVVPDGQVWAVLPEVSRQAVVGQLVRLASRALSVIATASEGDRQ
jgi:hypothetical protein